MVCPSLIIGTNSTSHGVSRHELAEVSHRRPYYNRIKISQSFISKVNYNLSIYSGSFFVVILGLRMGELTGVALFI